MKTIATIIAFLALTAPAFGQQPKPKQKRDFTYHAAQAALISSVAADFASGWRFADDSRYREGNPILGQSRLRQAGLMALFTVPALWGAHYLQKHGARTEAKVMLFVCSAIHFGAAAHNWSLK